LFRKGVRKGKREGKREGQREGQRALLKALLEERFGPLPRSVSSKLAAATAAELDRWARRTLKCKTLAATLT